MSSHAHPTRAVNAASGNLSQQLAARFFYVIGRSLLMLFRSHRTDTGVLEAILGFVVVMGVVAGIVRLPLRLILAALTR